MRWLATPKQGHSRFPHNVWSSHFQKGDSRARGMVMYVLQIIVAIEIRMIIVV